MSWIVNIHVNRDKQLNAIIMQEYNKKYNTIIIRLALGNQRFPVRVRLLAMCRGKLSAVIARLMCKVSVKWVEVVVRS